MKAIGTVLLVLVAVMGMAMPVLGATSGSSAGATAYGGFASQYTASWADNGWEYAAAGTEGNVFIGGTDSGSGAEASDGGMYADAGTGGDSVGIIADSYSYGYAFDDDPSGETDAGASSLATGSYVYTDGSAYSTTYPESFADAYGYAEWGIAESGAGADAFI